MRTLPTGRCTKSELTSKYFALSGCRPAEALEDDMSFKAICGSARGEMSSMPSQLTCSQLSYRQCESKPRLRVVCVVLAQAERLT